MKQTEQAHLPIAAQTHAGMSGKNNEDSFAVSAYQLENKHSQPVLLAVLSDGIGGHRAGEVASEMAVNRISQNVAESDGSQILETVHLAIQQASQEIYHMAQQDDERQGMGATCAVACVVGNRLYTATVGDSRIYLMRGQNIRQISIDHTWIQEALEAGIMTPDQVSGHPNAHVIRRYLGSPNPPEVDLRLSLKEGETNEDALSNQGLPLLSEDRVLLCSDGLSDLVTAGEILEVCHSYLLEQVPQALVDLANARGGHDNITVIVLEMTIEFAPVQRGKLQTSKKHTPLAVVLLLVMGLAVVLGALVGGWLWLRDRQGLSATATPTAVETVILESTTQPGILLPEPIQQTTPNDQVIPLPIELDNGATLTPWPTHTLQASATLPVLSTPTPGP
jgi:protein phosphatase